MAKILKLFMAKKHFGLSYSICKGCKNRVDNALEHCQYCHTKNPNYDGSTW